ncbi:hypothetical protein K469DRAFT_685359 [Zopfia rhizophila CBS 207.26]|uniref:Uncharacterized protein n=1 Tax=Zopfia rhizophila CBS 207.26 TaxID=1314779 RepID=A0A6A6EDW5_9PEZI|nr:hypothetical protein K469DRAFT_685359 [Zopfia rhizophila CBS 207.26]
MPMRHSVTAGAEKEETKRRKAQEKVEKQQVAQNRKRNKASKRKGKAAANTDQLEDETDFEGTSYLLEKPTKGKGKGKKKVTMYIPSDEEEEIVDMVGALEVAEAVGQVIRRGGQF